MGIDKERIPFTPYSALSVTNREELLDGVYRKILHAKAMRTFKPLTRRDYRVYFLHTKPLEKEDEYLRHFEKMSELLRRSNRKPVRAYLRDHPWILDHAKKIHLQPKVDDVPAVVADLLSLLAANGELNQQVPSFKVLVDHFSPPSSTSLGNAFVQPIAVVYLMHDAQRNSLLEAFRTYFQEYQQTPNNLVPRFNQRVDGIVFYAEGEGYLKFLMGRDIRSCYYDPATDYAIARNDPEHLPPSFAQRVAGKLWKRRV